MRRRRRDAEIATRAASATRERRTDFWRDSLWQRGAERSRRRRRRRRCAARRSLARSLVSRPRMASWEAALAGSTRVVGNRDAAGRANTLLRNASPLPTTHVPLREQQQQQQHHQHQHQQQQQRRRRPVGGSLFAITKSNSLPRSSGGARLCGRSSISHTRTRITLIKSAANRVEIISKLSCDADPVRIARKMRILSRLFTHTTRFRRCV